MHRAGATALSALLQFPAPPAVPHCIPCGCGRQAHYRELRTKPILTAVGPVKVSRPYYLCTHCHTGQFPADVELDIENTEFSPGVRRMQALVGQEAPFDHGREQMEMLAGLEVTAKSVERVAESIGADIARHEQQQIDRAVQLDLPIVLGEPVPILYIQMDGTGVPVVKKETQGRKGKLDGLPAHTREVKLGCVFTQTGWDEEGFCRARPWVHDLYRCYRERRAVRQTPLRRSLEPRLVSRRKESRHRRWRGMDLEHRQGPLPRSHSNRRPLPCPPAPVGVGAPALSQRHPTPKSMDRPTSKALA